MAEAWRPQLTLAEALASADPSHPSVDSDDETPPTLHAAPLSDPYERQRAHVAHDHPAVHSSAADGGRCRSPTKEAWLEAQRYEWADSRRRRSILEAQSSVEHALPALPSESEFEEQLKREWLRRLRDDREARLDARRRCGGEQAGKALEPSDREVWLLQKRRERELALRERRRVEQQAQLKPEVKAELRNAWEEPANESEQKQAWLRKRKEEHETSMRRRRSVEEEEAMPTLEVEMPTDREVWMLQKRRERELALKERRRAEKAACLKPACRDCSASADDGVPAEGYDEGSSSEAEDMAARADSTERLALEQVEEQMRRELQDERWSPSTSRRVQSPAPRLAFGSGFDFRQFEPMDRTPVAAAPEYGQMYPEMGGRDHEDRTASSPTNSPRHPRSEVLQLEDITILKLR